METVIAILAVAAVGIFLVLSIPADLRVNLETAPEKSEKKQKKLQVRLGLLFGLLNVDLTGGSQRREKSPEECRKRPSRRLTFRRVKRALLTKGLFPGVARFLRRILRAAKVRDFRLHVRFGFDNPADTGMLLAAAAPVLWMFRRWGEFFVEPDFDQEIARVDGKMDARIYPLRLVAASLMFLLSPATLKAAKTLTIE